MGRGKILIGVLMAVILPLLAITGIAEAQRFSAAVDEDQTINSSLYSMGKIVEIRGTINGDVHCAGQTVTIDAVVRGDVLCAGQDVTIAGKVDGDVRIAAQTAAISAEVSGSVSAAVLSFSLDAGATVGRDLSVTGDNLNIKGRVGRDVVGGATTMTLNGIIGRNAKVDSTNLRLKDDAAIKGDLSYTSPKKAAIAKGAVIEGKTAYQAGEADQESGWSFNFTFYLYVLSSVLLIGLLAALLFPKLLRRTDSTIRRGIGKPLLTGVIAGIAAPIVLIALFVTVIGIPLAVLLLLMLVVGSVAGGLITGYSVGGLVLRKRHNTVLAMVVGSALVVTACFLPWIGLLAILLAYWLGFGALLIVCFSYMREGSSAAKP